MTPVNGVFVKTYLADLSRIKMKVKIKFDRLLKGGGCCVSITFKEDSLNGVSSYVYHNFTPYGL